MHFRVARGARGDTAVADELPLARSAGRNPFACACRRNLRPRKANSLRIAEIGDRTGWWTCGSRTEHWEFLAGSQKSLTCSSARTLSACITEARPACQSL